MANTHVQEHTKILTVLKSKQMAKHAKQEHTDEVSYPEKCSDENGVQELTCSKLKSCWRTSHKSLSFNRSRLNIKLG